VEREQRERAWRVVVGEDDEAAEQPLEDLEQIEGVRRWAALRLLGLGRRPELVLGEPVELLVRVPCEDVVVDADLAFAVGQVDEVDDCALTRQLGGERLERPVDAELRHHVVVVDDVDVSLVERDPVPVVDAEALDAEQRDGAEAAAREAVALADPFRDPQRRLPSPEHRTAARRDVEPDVRRGDRLVLDLAPAFGVDARPVGPRLVVDDRALDAPGGQDERRDDPLIGGEAEVGELRPLGRGEVAALGGDVGCDRARLE
jgi:hypothetical protein